MTKSERMLRRKEAAEYVKNTYNMPCSPKSLAKYACIGSDGPPFRLVGRFPLYPVSGLDAWTKGKMSNLVTSTSQLAAEKAMSRSKTPSDGQIYASVSRRDALRQVLRFLDSIEGAGYGGMSEFEIARMTMRDEVHGSLNWDLSPEIKEALEKAAQPDRS